MTQENPNIETGERILKQALALAPFDGWTSAMLDNATQKSGYDALTWQRVFGDKPVDVIDAFTKQADEMMSGATSPEALAEMRVRDRIPHLVMVRLEQQAPHREAIRKAISVYNMPMNMSHSLKSLYRTVDEIWHLAGDTSTDFNFYTKRLTLSKIYSSTLLFWLNDESDDFADTREFLSRRIAGVMKFQKFKMAAKARCEKLARLWPKSA